jgi:hypothetical protein
LLLGVEDIVAEFVLSLLLAEDDGVYLPAGVFASDADAVDDI